MDTPITVGLTFHNAAATLAAAIASVFAQTHPHWRLILLDDASTDSSPTIARSVSDPRVQFLSWAKPAGFVPALNEIARLTQTPYLARMDADDLMHPERLEHQIRFLNAHPEVHLVDTAAIQIDAQSTPLAIRAEPLDVSPASAVARSLLIHPAVAGRAEWFRANPYDPTYRRAEDHELWCRTCPYTRFARLPQPLHFYRDTPGRARKYGESLEAVRRIYRTYGPRYLGWPRTAALLATGFAKPLLYSAVAQLGFESVLLGLRYTRLSNSQREEAQAALRTIAATAILPDV